MAASVTPSKEARRLFGRMVARSDNDFHIGLEKTLQLGVDLVRAEEPADVVDELRLAGWVCEHPDGGWQLFNLAPGH